MSGGVLEGIKYTVIIFWRIIFGEEVVYIFG